MFKHVSHVTLRSQSPPPPTPHLFHSETLLPLTFPISQHSWAVPHQSKGRFMGLMLQRVQTGLWDRMFGWYLALLKQTSHQNMITEGRGNRFLVLLQCIQAILMSTKYHWFTCFHMFKSQSLMTTRWTNVWWVHWWHELRVDIDITHSLALSLNPLKQKRSSACHGC